MNMSIGYSVITKVRVGNKDYIATSFQEGLSKGAEKEMLKQLKMLYVTNPIIKNSDTKYTACLENIGFCIVDMDVTVDSEPRSITPLPIKCKHSDKFSGGLFFGKRPMF